MEEIAISKFKATCLAVLEQVRVTGKPVRVTRFGKPVAEVLPVTEAKKGKKGRRILGTMAGTMTILGDLKESMYTEEGMAEEEKKWDEWLGPAK
jgi:prevent-host-death family protein